MHNRFLFLILFLFGTPILHAQVEPIDSLENALRHASNDSIRCEILIDLCQTGPPEKWNAYNTSLRTIAARNIVLAENKTQKNFFCSRLGDGYADLALHQCEDGDLSESTLHLFTQSLNLFMVRKDHEEIASGYNNLGFFYYMKGDFYNAVANYQNALREAKAGHSDYETSHALNNIAGLYWEIDEYDQALKYYKECASTLPPEENPLELATIYSNIGMGYLKQNKDDSANVYLNRSLRLAESIGDNITIVRCQFYLGEIDLKKNNYAEAQRRFEQGYALGMQDSNINSMATSTLALSRLYLNKNDLEKAKTFGEDAYTKAVKINNQELLRRTTLNLSEVYGKANEYNNAFIFLQRYNSVMDSINDKKSIKSLLNSQFKYEYDKKAIADSLKAIEQKNIFSLQQEKNRSQKIFLGVVIFLIVLFAAFLFNRFQATRKQKQLIEITNNNLVLANKDLERQHVLNQKIFSVISHDFRGPMLSLSLMLESFKTKSTDASLNSFVQSVNTEVNTANEIMQNLLNWARTEINIKDFDQKSCSVSTIFSETNREMQTKLNQKQLTLQAAIPDNSTIALPPDILRIALRNLLSNAIKFSKPNGVIELTYDAEKQLLAVKDYGIGMSEKTQAQLFQHEVDTALGTNNEEGFGIGLYIVSELLHKYQFKIETKSQLNIGTEFFIAPNELPKG